MAISKLFRSGAQTVVGGAEQPTPAGQSSGTPRTITSRLSQLVGLRRKPAQTAGETSTASAPPRRTLAELMHHEEPTTLTAGFLNVPLPDKTPQVKPTVLKIGSEKEQHKVQFSANVKVYGSDHQEEVKENGRAAKEYSKAHAVKSTQIKRAADLLQKLVEEKPGAYDGMIAQGFLPRQVLQETEGLTEADRGRIISRFREVQLVNDAARRFIEMVNSAPAGTFQQNIDEGELPEELHTEFDDLLLGLDKFILAACNRLTAEADRLRLEANLAALSDD